MEPTPKTLIQVNKITANKLKELRTPAFETYDEIINKLLKFYKNSVNNRNNQYFKMEGTI